MIPGLFYYLREGKNTNKNQEVNKNPNNFYLSCNFLSTLFTKRLTMQDAEELFCKKANSSANPLVSQLLSQLDQAVVYSVSGNIITNKKLWDNYSIEWKDGCVPWVEKMAKDVDMVRM